MDSGFFFSLFSYFVLVNYVMMMLSLGLCKWFFKSLTRNLSEYLSCWNYLLWFVFSFKCHRQRSIWMERHRKLGTLRNWWRILEESDKESKEQVWKKVGWKWGALMGGVLGKWMVEEKVNLLVDELEAFSLETWNPLSYYLTIWVGKMWKQNQRK